METIKFIVRGNPKAQKRHKTGRFSTYDPSTEEKDLFRAAVQHNAPEQLITTPISLDLCFYIQRPNSHFGTGKNKGKLKPDMPRGCTARPDIDNFIKFVMDALNGIYWKDDAAITHLTAFKVYDSVPRTEITVVYDYD
jgi:Holliday junction resolvase RusA-like endonuclease